MNAYDALCDAMVSQAKRSIAASRLRDMDRPIGEKRLDIDFYDRSDASRPVSDGEMVRDGRVFRWKGARWAVWRVRWTGSQWLRYRRVTGPMTYVEAVIELGRRCRELGLLRTTDS